MRGRCFVSVGFPWVMSSGAFGIVAFRSAKVRGARVLFRGAKGYYESIPVVVIVIPVFIVVENFVVDFFPLIVF